MHCKGAFHAEDILSRQIHNMYVHIIIMCGISPDNAATSPVPPV